MCYYLLFKTFAGAKVLLFSDICKREVDFFEKTPGYM